ncbi:MAG: helix-turn-helix transcriptional regulator [Rhodobacteraceae bacterium]|nr:helix-turn-helix transcriptional regulator [Paracoccaceae bacterium]
MNESQAAAGFAAMGADHRLGVLRHLVKAGKDGLLVHEIVEKSGIAASTMAHHLKTLREAGVITQQKQGRSTVSVANYSRLEALASYILAECCVAEND